MSQRVSPATNQGAAAAPTNKRSLADRIAALARGVAPAGQRLLTSVGLRPVAEIAPGDVVVTYDPEHQVSAERTVLSVETLSPEPIWEIGVRGDERDEIGRILRTTRHHRFLTPRGWRRVDRLRPGDYVASADVDGERLRAEIAFARPTPAVEAVYAVAVGGDQPLIVERLVAQGGSSMGPFSRLAWRMRGGLRHPHHQSGLVRRAIA